MMFVFIVTSDSLHHYFSHMNMFFHVQRRFIDKEPATSACLWVLLPWDLSKNPPDKTSDGVLKNCARIGLIGCEQQALCKSVGRIHSLLWLGGGGRGEGGNTGLNIDGAESLAYFLKILQHSWVTVDNYRLFSGILQKLLL